MSRLTRRAEADGVKAVWFGNREVFLEGEVGYAEADKLAHYEDLEEEGRLIDSDRQVDEGYLYDWYIHSVCDTDTPVWTEEYIKELASDFILIPRAKLAELKGGGSDE